MRPEHWPHGDGSEAEYRFFRGLPPDPPQSAAIHPELRMPDADTATNSSTPANAGPPEPETTSAGAEPRHQRVPPTVPRVVMPADPPTLTADAARALLRILVNASESRRPPRSDVREPDTEPGHNPP